MNKKFLKAVGVHESVLDDPNWSKCFPKNSDVLQDFINNYKEEDPLLITHSKEKTTKRDNSYKVAFYILKEIALIHQIRSAYCLSLAEFAVIPELDFVSVTGSIAEIVDKIRRSNIVVMYDVGSINLTQRQQNFFYLILTLNRDKNKRVVLASKQHLSKLSDKALGKANLDFISDNYNHVVIPDAE